MKNLILLSIGVLLCLPTAKALAFDYFNSDIDYWNKKEKKIKMPISPAIKGDAKSGKLKNNESKFSWEKTLNPKNDEFFKEGNHIPPAAFMEMARSPTDQNLKNWFKLVKKKNKISARLHKRMSEYLRKDKKLKPIEKNILVQNIQKLPKSNADYSRFRFRMYFESSCPHCKRMMTTMKDLRDMGYFVELRQIDKNPRPSQNLPFPVTFASKEELKEKNINAWPVLFVGDLKKKVVYRVNGFKTTEQILTIIRTK